MTRSSTNETEQEAASLKKRPYGWKKEALQFKQENQCLAEKLLQYEAERRQWIDERQRLQAERAQLEEKLQRTEQERQNSLIALADERKQLRRNRERHEAEKRKWADKRECLQAELAQLEEKLQRTEQERQTGLIALDNERERLRREREGWLMALLRKMGEGRPFIPDMVESLTEPEPGWTPQAILTELRQWIQDVSAQRLNRFPNAKEAPGGVIVLTASELTDPHHGFDVGNERPFESGQAQVAFKVIRRGWRLGTEVLHPARISTFTTEDSVLSKGEIS